MANHLSSISVAMNQVVKLLLQLVKVCSDAKASSSVAQRSAVKFKADFDEELLNKLKSESWWSFIKTYLLGSHILSWLATTSLFSRIILHSLCIFSSTKPVESRKKSTKVFSIGSKTKKLT
jgi:hypothetical protein